jgi:predicted dehydrogenase
MTDQDSSSISRRTFIGSVAAAGALAAGCGGSGGGGRPDPGKQLGYTIPALLDKAPEGQPLKAGLIGCGGRGTGAAQQFLQAGDGLSIVALSDIFPDRVERTRKILKERANVEIAEDMCFSGLDGYKKLIATDVDVVLMATPPYFRPEYFAAAVDAGKHTFIEKPACVDPVGGRSVMETASKAKTKGLVSVSGTNARHDRKSIEIYKRVMDGEIGDIMTIRAYFCTNEVWHVLPEKGQSDHDYMVRDWINWRWLSGDHIVEQQIHKLDATYWYMGAPPTKAIGFGSRARRITGDQFDSFCNDFEWANGKHTLSACRQLDPANHRYNVFIVGTNGVAEYGGTIFNNDGSVRLELEKPKIGSGVQEHIDLVTAIRTGEQRIEAADTAISTLMAVMGRETAYSGQEMTWDELMKSDLKLEPPKDSRGRIRAIAHIPTPGGEERRTSGRFRTG